MKVLIPSLFVLILFSGMKDFKSHVFTLRSSPALDTLVFGINNEVQVMRDGIVYEDDYGFFMSTLNATAKKAEKGKYNVQVIDEKGTTAEVWLLNSPTNVLVHKVFFIRMKRANE